MTFSWPRAIDDALKIKIRREKTLALSGNPDFIIKHNDEVIDAHKNSYVKLKARVTKSLRTSQKLAMDRRKRFAGK